MFISLSIMRRKNAQVPGPLSKISARNNDRAWQPAPTVIQPPVEATRLPYDMMRCTFGAYALYGLAVLLNWKQCVISNIEVNSENRF